MVKEEILDKFKNAYDDTFKYSDENHKMLSWYADKIVNKVRDIKDIQILSLGIGHGTVSLEIIRNLKNTLKKYIIVEGSNDIISEYIKRNKLIPEVTIINSYFEEYVSKCSELFDVVEMGFVLEHVDNPARLLKLYSGVIKKKGCIFIVVPNAKSLHRLIGFKAGLLDDPFELSDFDLQLGHKRYFDYESITTLINECGLRIVRSEGIFLKPVTTGQLEKLKLNPRVIDAMFEVGQDYPEISNAILIEAEK